MSLYFTIPFLALVAMLQSTLVPRLAVGSVRFDLMLLVVVSWSLRRGLQEGILWAFCGGMALDLFSGVPLGSTALAFMIVASVVALARASLFRSRVALPWVMAGLATLIYYGLSLVIMGIMGRPLEVGTILLRQVLPAMLYNVVLVTAVYGFLTWLDRRSSEPELRW
ncbi:MAG: rod shape-determining protein MreD [Thermoflexales bacterium]|nr:rod shape-determining protein MreD [Thermoflexales bacterium]